MSEHDLPDDIAALLRDVPAADDAVRGSHIAAALDEIGGAPTAVVVPFRSRTVLRFVAAAAVAAMLGVGIGWSVRGGDSRPLAEGSTDTVRNATVIATATTVKGAVSSSCDFSVMKDATWLGEYETDGKRYALLVGNLSVMWFDLDTCSRVQDIPHPDTTAP
ncbi:MAG: hypothetical protein ACKOFF_01500 [Acidimicrobiales bacterium]